MEKIANRFWIETSENPTVDWIVFGAGAFFLSLAVLATLLS
ncbi:MAG: hypothetical protein AAGD04_03275 [Pseudomonadota bacterium]